MPSPFFVSRVAHGTVFLLSNLGKETSERLKRERLPEKSKLEDCRIYIPFTGEPQV